MSEHKPRKRWIFVLLYYIGMIIVIFCGTSILIAFTGNPVGIILSLSGSFISLIGGGLIFVGNQEVDEPFSLWENEKVFASHGMPETISYPFHLENPSVIKGQVSGRVGPYEFLLAEFFGTSERYDKARYAVRPKVYLKGRGPEQTDIGPLSLPSGTYVLWFGEYPREIEASFTLNGTYRKKPYENIYQLGLTLLQIGIPIFITGSIFLSYGTLI